MKKVLIGCGAIVLLLIVSVVVFVSNLSNTIDVSVSRTIAAPSAEIHVLVDDLSKWPEWSYWDAEDPTLTYHYPTETTGVGAISEWTGDTAGTGRMTTTASEPEKGLWYDIEFVEGDEVMKSKGAVTYAPSGDATQVTFEMRGETEGFLGKVMTFVMTPLLEEAFRYNLEELARMTESK